MKNRAFRPVRGLIGGLALLLASALTIGLSGCGAPAYTYVADSAAGAYYKVPSGWHQISQHDLSMLLQASGSSGSGIWVTAFDAEPVPSAAHLGAPDVTGPVALAEVIPLSPTASNELSYNMLRDIIYPVTSAARAQYAQAGFQLTDFRQLRDQTITARMGVHGVRETFQYTYPSGQADTFDEDVLTNADQTVVYLLMVHCTNACYLQNQEKINTVMSSFTVGSPA